LQGIGKNMMNRNRNLLIGITNITTKAHAMSGRPLIRCHRKAKYIG